MTASSSVRLLHWPHQRRQREWCRLHSIPRILVVAPGEFPPRDVDVFEDWVRTPTSQDDLRIRARAVAARRLQSDRPVIENAQELVVGRDRVRLSPSQVRLVEVLADSFGEVVLRATLLATLRCRGRSDPSRNMLDLHIGRLRRKVEPLGLTIRTSWGRGYALESSQRPTVVDVSSGSTLRIDLDALPAS